MKITLIKPYSYSPRGFDQVNVDVGEQDIPDKFAQSAIKHGFAKAISTEPAKTKSRTAAKK